MDDTKEFFTSDLHALHKRIVELSDRHNVTTAEEHTEWLIELWNKQVRPRDKVWHLGDFCFSRKPEDWIKILSRLNGQKFFIKGNHDSGEALRGARVTWYEYKRLKREDQEFVLFHFPIASWDKQRFWSIHLHGHSHGNFKGQGRILDVGIDNSVKVFGEYKFFELQEIKELMKDKEIFVADNHRK